MNPHAMFSNSSLAEAAGWALVHSLWQGGIVAALLAGVLSLLRGASPALRYWAACAGMVGLLACPAVTFFWMLKHPAPPPPVRPMAILQHAPAASENTLRMGEAAEPSRGMSTQQPMLNAEIPEGAPPPAVAPLHTFPFPKIQHDSAPALERRWSKVRVSRWLEPYAPLICWLWLAGVALQSARHLGGWAYLRVLVRQGLPVPAPFAAPLSALSGRLAIRREIRLLVSERLASPVVLGWLRPVILLPASALSGMPPEVLEAVIAHELAHVRRGDYLVNVLHTVAETLLFYHPACWWISRRIRAEREFCCDDVAVTLLQGDRLRYSRALLAVADASRALAGTPALAMAGGPFVHRMRRLLGVPPTRSSVPRRVAGGAIAFLLLISATVGLQGAVRHPGSATVSPEGKSLSESAPSVSDEKFTSGPQLRLTGRVTLPSGEAATSATVRLLLQEFAEGPLRPAGVETTVTEQGEYTLTFEDLPRLTLQAECSGYAPLQAKVGREGSDGVERPNPGMRRAKQDVRLTTGTRLAGRIVDAEDRAVTAALVRVQPTMALRETVPPLLYAGEVTAADSQGRFAFSNVPPGPVNLEVVTPGFSPLSLDVTAPDTSVALRLDREGAAIEGMVIAYPNRMPVSSATIELRRLTPTPGSSRGMYTGPPIFTATDPTGYFRFDRLGAGRYRLLASGDGWHPYGVDEMSGHEIVDLARQETTGPLVLTVYRGHTITGRVTEEGTSAPVAGARITIPVRDESTTPPTAVTDENGRYELTGISLMNPAIRLLAPERISLNVSAPRHISRTRPGEVRVVLRPEQLIAVKDIEVAPMVFLSGKVGLPDGRPAGGAKVIQLGWDMSNPAWPSARAGDDGTYELAVMPWRPARLLAVLDGFGPALSGDVQVRDEGTSGVDIALYPPGSVAGTVLDSDGRPVEGAKVQAYSMMSWSGFGAEWPAKPVYSSPQGTFRISGLPPGKVVVGAIAPTGHSTRQEEPILAIGEAKEGMRLVFETSGRLTGRVITSDGRPAPGARIRLYSKYMNWDLAGRNVTTDGDGRFAIDEAPLPPLHVAAFGGGGHSQVEVTDPSQTHVEIQLQKNERDTPVTLDGVVVDAESGAPVKDAQAILLENPDETFRVNEEGHITVPNLPANQQVTFRITAKGYPPQIERVAIPTTLKRMDYIFRLSQGTSLRGRVVDQESRNPVAGVEVHVLRSASRSFGDEVPETRQWTRSDGSFEFAKLSEGEVTVRFLPEAPLGEVRKATTLVAGVPNDLGVVELAAPVGIEGQVVREDTGAPVAAAEVHCEEDRPGSRYRTQTTTDVSGRFRFYGLQRGQYLVYTIGHTSARADLRRDEKRDVLLRVGSGIVRGRVTRAGEPAFVSVSLVRSGAPPSQLGPRKAETNRLGEYRIENVAAGKWLVQVRAGSGESVTPAEEVTVGTGEDLSHDIVLPAGVLQGRVLDENGAPVDMAQIELARVAESAEDIFEQSRAGRITGQDGSFRFVGLRKGSYTVTARTSAEGEPAYGVEGPISINDEGSARDIVVRLRPSGGTLVSTALTLDEGAPLPQAWCRIFGPSGEVVHGRKRGEDGVLTLSGLAPGAYRVSVSAWGYSVSEREVLIAEGKTVTLEDVLYAAGSMEWTLVDEEGKPMEGADCTLEPMDSGSIESARSGKTDAKGQFTARGLAPGTYRARASRSGGSQAAEQLFAIRAKSHTSHTTSLR